MEVPKISDFSYLYELYIRKIKKVLDGNKLLDDEKDEMLKIISKLRELIDNYNFLSYKIGSVIDYNQKLEEGYSEDMVKRWHSEDENYYKLCLKKSESNNLKREYMFGYPANMLKPSALCQYLKYLEANNYLMNNCGNPLEQGNYQMDNKEIELMIIDLFKEKFSLNKNEYTAYVTTGGTEGNIFGLNKSLLKYPNAYLYCFSDTHYSVNKSNFSTDCIRMISENDVCKLLSEIIYNYEKNRIPAVLLLTYGTTKDGRVDDILLIKKILDLKKVPYYLHIDGALYGGIPNNQINAPYLDISSIKPDSLSISFHKYLGVNRCNGIVLSKDVANDNFIDYIGQNDTTLSGSRDFLPYSTYQQIKEVLERSSNHTYNENIEYLKNLFNEKKIVYQRGDINGNIFVINKPSDTLCKKYQLATFNKNGYDYAHIIIFPFHKKEIIKELVNDLEKEKEDIKVKTKKDVINRFERGDNNE